jgi:mutator family transposase
VKGAGLQRVQLPPALKGDFGELELETPRDRQASFEPKIVAKGQTRFTGFDDKTISMHARGMSTREIGWHNATSDSSTRYAGEGKLECARKLRQEIKGPATVIGGERCWCPDKNIPVN